MTKKQQLQRVLDDYNSHTCTMIELHWSDGTRAGIGNEHVISVAMDALKRELKRQIEEA